MPHRARLGLAALGLLAATAPVLTPALAGSSQAASIPSVTVSPRAFDRGADVDHASLVGNRVWVGDQRIAVPGQPVYLLGAGGGGYLVYTFIGERARVVRVASGQDPVQLGGDATGRNAYLSSDGTRLTTAQDSGSPVRTSLRVVDTTSGRTLGSRVFSGRVDPVDASGDRQIVSSHAKRYTVEWRVGTEAIRRLADVPAYRANLGADRIAYSYDPTRDYPCTRVERISAPGVALSRSCSWSVASFSPDGALMAQMPSSTDGPGPTRIRLAGVAGRPIVEYVRSTSTWTVDLVDWLGGRRVLLTATSGSSEADVACLGADCERVSDLRPSPYGG